MASAKSRPLRLAGLLGAAVTAFEIGVDAALLRVFLALSPEKLAAAVLALGPALALALLWWVLFPRRWLRPLRRWLDDAAAGREPAPATQEEAQEALVRFTRRTLLHRSLAMLAIALVLGPTVAAATDLGLSAAATIAGVTVVIAFWCNTLRAFLYRRALRPLAAEVFAGVDPLRAWSRSLRERIFTGAYLLGGVGVLFVGLYGYLVMGVPEEVVSAFLFTPPVVGGVGLVWGFLMFHATAPILRFMGEERERPAEALAAALALPHVVGLSSIAAWTTVAALLVVRQTLRGALLSQSLQVGAGVVAVGAAVVVLHVIWTRNMLEPAVEAAARALGDAYRPRSGRFGLYGRLVYGPLALMAFGGTFAAMTAYQEHEQALAAIAERAAEADLARLREGLEAALGRGPIPAAGLCARLPAEPPDVAFVAEGAAIACATTPLELPLAATSALAARDAGTLTLRRPWASMAWRRLDGGPVVGVLRPRRLLEGGVRGTPALVFVFAALALVSLGLVALVARDVARPLRRRAAAAARIGQGDLGTPIPPGGDDEVGELAHAVERMRRELARRLAELEELNRSLEARVKARTADLEDANRQLSRTLKALADAQDRVIAQEKMASIGRLVAGIAHEINNPLNFVTNGLPPIREAVEDLRPILAKLDALEGKRGAELEAAAADALAEKRRRDIEDLSEADRLLAVMQTGVSRMASIVRALRDFSRADRPDEAPQPFDLSRLVDDSLALLRHDLEGRVRVEREDGVVGPVLGRPGPLGQVLVNLVKNAAQAAARPGGLGTIRVVTRRAGGAVELEVADDGPGIPSDVLPKIFEPFFSTKAQGEGTGLGLSIVHGIVEREGGRIRVDTEAGSGTRFVVVLPGA